MRLIIPTIGTRGDVQPYLALALSRDVRQSRRVGPVHSRRAG